MGNLFRLFKHSFLLRALAIGLLLLVIAFPFWLNSQLRPGGLFWELFEDNPFGGEIAVFLAIVGLVLFAWVLRTMERNYRLELANRTKWAKLIGEIHFVQKLNDEVIEELKQKKKDDSTIEIYEGYEDPYTAPPAGNRGSEP